MSFLQRFLPNTDREGAVPPQRSSFQNVSEEQLEAHLNIARYGNFVLTDAVRPSYDLQVVPQSGYRHDVYQNADTGIKIPVLMGAVSKESVLDLFFELLDPLGNEVDMVLETSHERNSGHQDLVSREHRLAGAQEHALRLRGPAAQRRLLGHRRPQSADSVRGAVRRAQALDHVRQEPQGVREGLPELFRRCDEEIKFITEAEHVHSSSEEYFEQFQQLRYRLGIDE